MTLPRRFKSGWEMQALPWLLLIALGLGCNGTESGNPINPPGPPSVHEPGDTGDDVTDGSDLGTDDTTDEPSTGFESPDDHSPVDDAVDAVMDDDDMAPDWSGADDDMLDDASELDDDDRMLELPDDAQPDDDLGGAQDEAADDSEDPRNPDLDIAVDDARPDFPDEFGDDIAGGDDGSVIDGASESDGDMASPSAGGSDVGGSTAMDACDESLCQNAAAQRAQQLSQPMSSPAPFDMASCTEAPQESRCDCASGGFVVSVSTSDAGCALSGRFGACLYDSSEFGGCTTDGGQCQTLCDELDQQRQTDAASTIAVSVRRSACLPNDTCAYVLETETMCLRGPQLTEVDCAMSDDELLGLTPQGAADAGTPRTDAGAGE